MLADGERGLLGAVRHLGIAVRVREARMGKWISLGISVVVLVLAYITALVLTAWVR